MLIKQCFTDVLLFSLNKYCEGKSWYAYSKHNTVAVKQAKAIQIYKSFMSFFIVVRLVAYKSMLPIGAFLYSI